MPRFRGFRFGELVVAALLVSSLASAVTQRLLAARERSQSALATARMKATAIAIEAYFVDHETFPACAAARAAGAPREYESQQLWQPRRITTIAAGVATANSFAPADSGASRQITFALADTGGSPYHTLTTPLAYLARFEEDPFADTPGASLGYFSHGSNLGWVLFSFGPDRDENASDGPGDLGPRVERLYDLSNQFPYMWSPTGPLISTLYDPTNGLASDGDLYWLGGN